MNLLDFCHWRESDTEPRAYQRRDRNPDKISLPYPDNQLKEMTFGWSFSNTRYIQGCVKQAMQSIGIEVNSKDLQQRTACIHPGISPLKPKFHIFKLAAYMIDLTPPLAARLSCCFNAKLGLLQMTSMCVMQMSTICINLCFSLFSHQHRHDSCRKEVDSTCLPSSAPRV